MTNDTFIDIFGVGLDSAAIVMIEFQLRTVGDMGDQLAIRLQFMRSSSDLFALWTYRHGSLCKGVNRRRSWRSTWRSMALCESTTDRRPVEWGYHTGWVKTDWTSADHIKSKTVHKGLVERIARDRCVSTHRWWERNNFTMLVFNIIASSLWLRHYILHFKYPRCCVL